ncbi:Ig-like domain-containing protein [Paraburkholderia flagellata]|uniref:Ig-like domain-containing protein n=1 Tax=Paraburkholderia flagellata TaxID=2883241 RepID=UPI001F432764|nr:Ig-like domain-containing protein [Paraburkholderia flagellata]
MRSFRWVAAALMSLVLTACGGGGNSSGSPQDLGSLTIRSDVPQIQTGSHNSVATVTAQALDTNGRPMQGVIVEFDLDSGEFLGSPIETTDANGIASTTITVGEDESNRTIHISASTNPGDSSSVDAAPITEETTGTTVQLAAPATPPEVFGTVTVIATVTDADGNPVGGIPVALTSAAGNQIAPASVTSLSDGTAGFAYTALKAGNDTLTVTISGSSASQSVVISPLASGAIDFTMTESQDPILSGASSNTATIGVTAHTANGVASGLPVSLAVDNGGTLSVAQGVTDANGLVQTVVGYGTDKSNRLLTVTAQGAGHTNALPIEVIGTTLTVVPGDSPMVGGPAVPWSVLLLDADGAPIQGSVQLNVRSSPAGEMLDYQLNPITQPLPLLGMGADGQTSFDLGPTSQGTGFSFIVSGTFGIGNQRSNAVPSTVLPPNDPASQRATVTAQAGTNLAGVVQPDQSTYFGWVVPAQTSATGPAALQTSPQGYATIQAVAQDLNGQQATILLRATRHNACSIRPMNASIGCQSSAPFMLDIWYDATDNVGLPPGEYKGQFVVHGLRTSTPTPFQILTIYLDITKSAL